MFKKIISLVIMAFIALVFLSACTSESTPTLDPNRPALKFEWTLWEGDYTVLVAQEKGFFEKHGVEVELMYYEDYYQSLPDMAGAKIDGGLFAVGDLILSSSMANIKAVMVYDNGGMSSIVSTPDIQNAADLAGKRIGVVPGTSYDAFVLDLLNQGGLTANDVTLISIDPEQVPGALGKTIDAGYTWEPYTTQATDTGNNLLFSNDQGGLTPDLIVFRQDVLEQRGEDVRAFLAAWSEALEYRLANPDEAEAIAMKYTGLSADELGITGDDRLYGLEDNLKFFAENPGSDLTSIYFVAQVTIDEMIKVGDITTPPNLDSLFDPSFLK